MVKLISLSSSTGIPAKERPIKESELNTADKIMIVGTTTDFNDITQINQAENSSGEPGKITMRPQKLLREDTRAI